MSTSILRALETDKLTFGPDVASRRLELLRRLDRARLGSAAAILRLHELLCFVRAYPDDPAVLAQCRRMLATFAQRADVRRFGPALADTGVAGASITYSFFAATAERLARRWPDRLSVVWDAGEDLELLEKQLEPMALWSETPGLDELPFDAREWIEAMRGDLGDGAFVASRMAAAYPDPFIFERAYEGLGLTMRLEAGGDTPSRTRAEGPVKTVHFQRGPIRASRPDVQQVLQERPLAIRPLSRRQGQHYVEMAQEAMVTRQRDLDAFAYADADDVRIVDWEDGLQFAAIGMLPERRLMLEAVYGFLTLRNGAPIGYVLNSAISGSAEIAYNVFDTFRGGEAGHIYGRVLATVKALFGVDSFTIYPYQLGDHNDEALQSGAWWFYQKLGFRARDRSVLQLMRRELAVMKKRRGHRSSIATLRKLAAENVYYHEGSQRDDVIGLLPLGNVGMAVTKMLAKRFGGNRERAVRECEQQLHALLELPKKTKLDAGQRLWMRRWAPLVAALPGVKRWSLAERRALGEVIVAKGAAVRATSCSPSTRTASCAPQSASWH